MEVPPQINAANLFIRIRKAKTSWCATIHATKQVLQCHKLLFFIKRLLLFLQWFCKCFSCILNFWLWLNFSLKIRVIFVHISNQGFQSNQFLVGDHFLFNKYFQLKTISQLKPWFICLDQPVCRYMIEFMGLPDHSLAVHFLLSQQEIPRGDRQINKLQVWVLADNYVMM